MSTKSLNEIKNSTEVYDYEDETFVLIDFGLIVDGELTYDLVENTLILYYSKPHGSDQTIEFELPEEFNDPTVTINNGVITVKQVKDTGEK